MVTITQLEYLIAVDRLRHFGKAAKACHVTQPSLSMQIQKAEEHLGVLIFDRDKQPVLPTPKGVQLIEQARAVVREHAKLLQLSKSAAGEVSGPLHLGIIPTLAPYLLPRFLEAFARRYPKVRLAISEMKTDAIIQAIRGDTLDAALLATPLGEAGIRERVLFYEPFYVYANAHHPLAKRRSVPVGQLGDKDIWLLQDGHCFRSQVANYCALDLDVDQSTAPIRFEGGNFETLRNLIRGGRGYTLFPELFIETLTKGERRQSVRPFTPPAPVREVSLIHRREHWKSDIIDAVEAEIRAALPPSLSAAPGRGTQVVPIN